MLEYGVYILRGCFGGRDSVARKGERDGVGGEHEEGGGGGEKDWRLQIDRQTKTFVED